MQKQESEDQEEVHTLNELRFIQKMNKSLTSQLNKKIHQIICIKRSQESF